MQKGILHTKMGLNTHTSDLARKKRSFNSQKLLKKYTH